MWNHFGLKRNVVSSGLKLLGFIAESVSCSGSSGDIVRNHLGIAFTLARNSQQGERRLSIPDKLEPTL